MSSLLQFSGETGRRGVRLQFYRTEGGDICGPELDLFECPRCGRSHPVLALAWRKPRGMWGCWVLFEYLGEMHGPDLSHPIAVGEFPRGSVVLSEKDSEEIWHSD